MKKMMKWIAAFATAMLLGASAFAMSASAAGKTIEDVYDALRGIGFNEYLIQMCKTQFEQSEHNEEGVYDGNGNFYTYETLIANVEYCDFMIWGEVAKYFGVPVEDVKIFVDALNADMTSTTTTNTGSDSGSSTTTTTTTTQALVADPNTGKLFINMTLAEKKAYVLSLPESERASFLASLSTAERNSIIKELSADAKASIADQFVQIGQQMGMHITVNDIEDDKIDVSIRDGEGNLIDNGSIGVIVADTGWNLTGPLAIAMAMILAAIGGIAFTMYRAGKETEEDVNG